MSHTIHTGDSAETLKQYPDNHFDSIVTDPPYGIEFLGKEWDSNTGAIEIWRECLRVLKPGGHLLAFSAARTYHHLATNIEQVGFEIRDQLMWIYASGFPKAQDIGKAIQRKQGVEKTQKRQHNEPSYGGRGDHITQDTSQDVIPTSAEALKWSGWKTALKPAHEPIVMARKPFRGSTMDNVLRHGVGALNIDASRIPFEDAADAQSSQGFNPKYAGIVRDGGPLFQGQDVQSRKKDIPQGGANGFSRLTYGEGETSNEDSFRSYAPNEQGRFPSNVMGEIPDYQKYFYCPKVSRRERHCGFEQDQIPDPLENYSQGDVKNHPLWDPSIGTNIQRLKHKILEHNRDLGPKDPLAHIPTNPSGMYEQDERGKCGERYEARVEAPRTGNNHPTVKPVALMRYLIKLVTPTNGRVLDPFLGSGSTGMAACELGHDFVGSEQNADYVQIANSRIEGWLKQHRNPDFDRLFDDTSD